MISHISLKYMYCKLRLIRPGLICLCDLGVLGGLRGLRVFNWNRKGTVKFNSTKKSSIVVLIFNKASICQNKCQIHFKRLVTELKGGLYLGGGGGLVIGSIFSLGL